jgi:hypothetical protein
MMCYLTVATGLNVLADTKVARALLNERILEALAKTSLWLYIKLTLGPFLEEDFP